MVGTAPIGLFVMWHDRRMEKTHIAAYREDRKPYEDSLNSSLTKLEQSNASLRKEITWYSNELRRYKDADHNVFFIRENKYLQEISDLKAEISRLNNMLSNEKELSYEKGFQEGERKGRLSAHTLAAKVMDSRIEKTRIESYQDGYKDGQADFPKGINILNEQ